MTKYQVSEEQEEMLHKVAVVSRSVTRKERLAEQAKNQRDELIVTARGMGLSSNQLAKAAGLSSTRISQIEERYK